MPQEKRIATLERLRSLSNEELTAELGKLRGDLFRMRGQNVTRQLENVSAISQTKKQIARVMTLMRERELVVQGE